MRRGTFDIVADILRIVALPSSETEIIACANLSFKQFRKYISLLQKLEMVDKELLDGKRARFSITNRGREYLSHASVGFGRIMDGGRSVWESEKRIDISNDQRNPLLLSTEKLQGS